MRSSAFLALFFCLSFTVAVAEESTSASVPEEVLDVPGGKPIAILLPGAVRSAGETREGYMRVRLEGWVRLPGTVAPPAVPTTPPAPAGNSGAAASVLSGTIVATLSSGEVRYGAGARVTVLGSLEELDKEWAGLKSSYQEQSDALEARIRLLENQEKTALSSSDNLTQASRNLERARASLRDAEKERRELRERFATRAEGLFGRHQVAETVADAEGRYAFPSLPPGSYRLLGIQSLDGEMRRWYVPLEVGPAGGVKRDLRSDDTGPDPFFGTR